MQSRREPSPPRRPKLPACPSCPCHDSCSQRRSTPQDRRFHFPIDAALTNLLQSIYLYNPHETGERDVIKKLPISTVRAELRNIVDDLYADAGAIIITRNEKAMAVLISYEDFRRIETIFTLPEPAPAH